MRKITKKTTTEEFLDGQLIKRTIEETVEEISDEKLSQVFHIDKASPWDTVIKEKWGNSGPTCDTLFLQHKESNK